MARDKKVSAESLSFCATEMAASKWRAGAWREFLRRSVMHNRRASEGFPAIRASLASCRVLGGIAELTGLTRATQVDFEISGVIHLYEECKGAERRRKRCCGAGCG